MVPRTIVELVDQVDVQHIDPSTIEFVTESAWTVEDEQQLSYTTIISLAECLRELHWERDLDSLNGRGGLNTISRSVNAQFRRSIMVDSLVRLRYAITDIADTSYGFAVEFVSGGEPCATVDMELVFIHPNVTGRANAPDEVRNMLASSPAAQPSDSEG